MPSAEPIMGTSEQELGALIESVRSVISARKRRYEFLDRTIFADPGWDILLNVFLSYLESKRLGVTDVASEADVPLTTTMRYIDILEGRQLICRLPDRFDSRRTMISMTAEGAKILTAYFEAPDGLEGS